ncbi:MAG: maleylpyruvate isomerase family mycothiol-dependent enzyme [Acidimicrobiia bacterium]
MTIGAVDHLDALAGETEAFYEAAARCDHAAAVPACLGWDVADLVFHVGAVHRFWAEVVERPGAGPGEIGAAARPSDSALASWARAASDRLERALRTATPSTTIWTWAAQKDVAFVRRRMAHETAIHCWDLRGAAGAGASRPVEASLAADGIDEFVSFFLQPPAAAVAPGGGSVHLHCTDVEGEWLVAADGTVSLGHAKGDAAIRGPASDMLLALWRRLPLGNLEVIGAEDVAERFVGASRTESFAWASRFVP